MAKKATQPPLPGMPSVGRSKKAPAQKAPKPKSNLTKELGQGYRPMFMTAGEIAKNVNLGDAGMWGRTDLGQEKDPEQKRAEKSVLARKLKESKEGTSWNSHYSREFQVMRDEHGEEMWKNGKYVPATNAPSLHDAIRTEGFKDGFDLHHTTIASGRIGEIGTISHRANLYEGHHRLAALRNINPKQFVPVDWIDN